MFRSAFLIAVFLGLALHSRKHLSQPRGVFIMDLRRVLIRLIFNSSIAPDTESTLRFIPFRMQA